MKLGTRLAIVAAGAALAGPASAADLGGNCCADLEERIAELEATTARKGNRKVSLTIYGHVNEAIFLWDDGFEQNQTIATNDNARTRFGFKGENKISDGWKAGYVLEIGVRGNNSKRFNQIENTAEADERGLDVRHSRWFLASKELGTVSMGTTPTAMEGATEINLAHTKDIAKYSDVEDSALGLFLRNTAGGLSNGGVNQAPVQWRRLIKHTGDQPGEGERREGVWYVSPELGGFNFEAGWGADDTWDLGLKYKGEVAGFKIAAGLAYGENHDENGDSAFFECTSTAAANGNGGESRADCQQFGGSVSVMHEATGLYFNVAGGVHKDDNVLNSEDFVGTAADDETTFWAFEAGIEQKFTSLGKTTIFGQYYDLDGGANARVRVDDADPIHGNPLAGDARVFSSGLRMYGGGVVQELANASMLIYAYYRHYEADLELADEGTVFNSAPLEDLDVGVVGAIIKF